MNNTPTRIPRIQGSTLLAQTHSPEATFAHILSHYLSNGFTYLGKRMSTEELSYYTEIPESSIHQAIINSSGVYNRLFNPDNIQDTARVIFGRALEGSLGDRARILKFSERLESHLAESQSVGNTLKVGYLYQKSLDSVLRSTQALTSLLSQVLPKGQQLNIFMGLEKGPAEDTQSSQYIGRAEALQLISEQVPNPLLVSETDGVRAQELYAKHQLGTIAPILANPKDDGEVMMGHLPKVSEILIDEIYDEQGNLVD